MLLHAVWILHIPRTFIVTAWTKYEMLRRFQDVANSVNKRLFLCLADKDYQTNRGDKVRTYLTAFAIR